jgi:hypothetical protein
MLFPEYPLLGGLFFKSYTLSSASIRVGGCSYPYSHRQNI